MSWWLPWLRPRMGWVGGALWVFLAGPCEAAESVRGKQPEPLPVTQSPTTHAGFSLVPLSESGISFTNMLSVARAAANHNFMNGSGVALGISTVMAFAIFTCVL